MGSRKLASPAKSTRPTADRIRESIFSSLESKGAIEKKVVLDLYAGTGALGLEALSRGAVSATLVESNKQAAGVCIQNSRMVQDALELEGHRVSVRVQIQPVQKFLDSNQTKFDLVFIDPPYELSNNEIESNLKALLPNLSDDGLVLVERSDRGEKLFAQGYGLLESKNYGDTAVYWLSPIR